jgi:hypothetical protein
MRTSIGIVIAALVATSSSLFATPAGAQHHSRDRAVVVSSSRAPVVITDEKLDAVVDATNDIKDIRRDYDEQRANARPADRERLADKADSEITGAITDAGLSVAEYDAILQVARKDPVLRARLIERTR